MTRFGDVDAFNTRQHRGTNLLASGCDSRQTLALLLSELQRLAMFLSKVACPIALIFKKRRAFSLQLFSDLFGCCFLFLFFTPQSHLLSHLSLCPFFYPFLCYVCLHTQFGKDERKRYENNTMSLTNVFFYIFLCK